GAAGAGAAGAGAGAAAGSGAGAGAGSDGASAAGASASAAGASSTGAGAGASPASPTTASTAPTSTVSPSGTLISTSVPLTGDGTSESTLSVETSKRGSSSATVSPTCLNHFVIVPSVTVSPSWGIVMSAIVADSLVLRARGGGSASAVERPAGERDDGFAEDLGQGGVGLDERREVLDRGFPVDGQVPLAELLGHPRTGHVDPEDPAGVTVGVLLGDHLHHALGLVHDHRPAVVVEAALLGDHLVAG